MAYSYKGSISFGLVYIPIKLHKAVRENSIGFNMLDRKTKTRVKYSKTINDKPIKQEDIVKGYEYEEDKYVIFEEDDFEKIKTEKDKNITIECFVDLKEIDPIYFDTPYFVEPTGGDNAYSLLISAMQKSGKVGIAKTVLGTKETLIAMRAQKNELLLSTLHFENEIIKNPAKGAESVTSKKELAMAAMLIDSMTEKFEPKTYKDEYRERLEKAIMDKISGKQIVAPKDKQHTVLDLMDALEQSLKIINKPKKTIKRPKSDDGIHGFV